MTQKKGKEMSEYKPITSELRKYATVSWDPWPDARDRLYQMCDRIDAVHAGLERENAELRRQLDNLMYESRPMTDENMAAEGWVRLPVADGEPIHIGDMMERMERRGEVIALVLADNPWGDGNHWAIQLEGEHAPTVFDSLFHHYVPDTWERIIEDALDGYHDTDFDKLVARCKKLAGEAE